MYTKMLEEKVQKIGRYLFSKEVDVADFLREIQSLHMKMIELSTGVSQAINKILNPELPYLKIYPLRSNIKGPIEYYNLLSTDILFKDESEKKIFLNIDLFKVKFLFLSNLFFLSLVEMYEKEEISSVKEAVKSLISILYQKFLVYDILHIVLEPQPVNKEEISKRGRTSATTRISCLLSDSYKCYWFRIDLPHKGQKRFHLNMEELDQYGNILDSLTKQEKHIQISEMEIEPTVNPFCKLETYLLTKMPYNNFYLSTVKNDFDIKKEVLKYHLLSLLSTKLISSNFIEHTDEIIQYIRELIRYFPLIEEKYKEDDFKEPEVWYLIGQEILEN